MRTIKKLHKAEYRPIHDLITYSPLPTASLQQVDPFIFLNHHGPQTYKPGNKGLPFGPHPHRGMETVTFILKGDIAHKDSSGGESVIHAGGVQWMTAGSGLIHNEVSSEKFKKDGGEMEILQLWINLPAKHKMVKPAYKGLKSEDIPHISEGEGVAINLISGRWKDQKGAVEPLTDIFLSTIEIKKDSTLSIKVDNSRNIFFYVVQGMVSVNGKKVSKLHLVEFNNDGEDILIGGTTDSTIIFGHADPFNEPMVAQGPFVMNTMEEIREAYEDYQNGKMGTWK